MIFNEIKCHVKSSLRLVGGDASPASPPVSARQNLLRSGGGMHPLHPSPLCPRVPVEHWVHCKSTSHLPHQISLCPLLFGNRF